MFRKRAYLVGAVLVMVVLAGCAGSDGGGLGGGSQGAPQRQSDSSAPGGEASQNEVLSRFENGSRVVIRSAEMAVEVQEYESAFREVRRIARSNGGFVADWDHRVEKNWDRGTVVVRVPARNLSDVRDAYAELGEVERETVNARDFTDEFVDNEQRLRELRAERERLNELYNATSDSADKREILDDIERVNSEIRDVRNSQQGIRQREAYSTIHLDLHEPESEKPPRNYESAFGFQDAFVEAFYGGLRTVKFVVVALGYLIPTVLSLLAVGLFLLVTVRVFEYARRYVDRYLPAPAAARSPPRGEPVVESSAQADRQEGGASGSEADGGDGDGAE